jgi:hypothetical protein
LRFHYLSGETTTAVYLPRIGDAAIRGVPGAYFRFALHPFPFELDTATREILNAFAMRLVVLKVAFVRHAFVLHLICARPSSHTIGFATNNGAFVPPWGFLPPNKSAQNLEHKMQ